MKVLAFGEILFDVIEGKPFLGGAPLNFAAHLSKFGAQAFILSKVGDDELGKKALDAIEILGMDIGFIQIDDKWATGTVDVILESGQPDYDIFENVAYDFIDAVDIKGVNNLHFDILYYGTLAQRNEHSRNSLAKLVKQGNFRRIFYDVNLRKGFFSREILQFSLEYCNILKLNDEEVVVLGKLFFGAHLTLEEFSKEIAKKFAIDTVVITAGAKGCMVYEKGNLHFVHGYPASVVDTVGAGDSFSAAFLFKYFSCHNPVMAADAANQLGAFVASCRGPIPPYSNEIKMKLGINGNVVVD